MVDEGSPPISPLDFSIIIPAFDAATSISAAVTSALAAGPPGLEVVVVDDGSHDDTSAVVRERHPGIAVVTSHENRGPAHARNLGAATARGSWLLFLDADDTLLPGAIIGLAAVITPSAGLVTAQYLDAVGPDAQPRDGFLAGTFAVRSDVFRRIDGYDPELRYAENSELQMRLLPELERSRLVVIDTDTPIVRLRPPGQGRNYDRARMDAARHLLHKHRDYFAAHRRERATHQAIVAVNAERVGEWRLARRYATRAIRSEPGNPRHYARLGRTLLYGWPRSAPAR